MQEEVAELVVVDTAAQAPVERSENPVSFFFAWWVCCFSVLFRSVVTNIKIYRICFRISNKVVVVVIAVPIHRRRPAGRGNETHTHARGARPQHQPETDAGPERGGGGAGGTAFVAVSQHRAEQCNKYVTPVIFDI